MRTGRQAGDSRGAVMLKQKLARRRSARGFSLIELMVALVIGLIVIGAVLALIMSIIRSNNETIQSTRLTQELRATMGVIATDLRRARGVEDPFQMTGPGLNPYALVFTDTANCVRYSYFDRADGANRYFHTISLANGAVLLGEGTAEPACAAGQQLSSTSVVINQLTFAPMDVPAGGDARRARSFLVTLRGSLANRPEIQRTLTQRVFTRSVAGN